MNFNYLSRATTQGNILNFFNAYVLDLKKTLSLYIKLIITLQHQTLRHTLLGRAKEHLSFHPFGLENLLYVIVCKLIILFLHWWTADPSSSKLQMRLSLLLCGLHTKTVAFAQFWIFVAIPIKAIRRRHFPNPLFHLMFLHFHIYDENSCSTQYKRPTFC